MCKHLALDFKVAFMATESLYLCINVYIKVVVIALKMLNSRSHIMLFHLIVVCSVVFLYLWRKICHLCSLRISLIFGIALCSHYFLLICVCVFLKICFVFLENKLRREHTNECARARALKMKKKNEEKEKQSNENKNKRKKTCFMICFVF